MTGNLAVPITQLNHAQPAQLTRLAMCCIIFIPLPIKYGFGSAYVASTAALAVVSLWTCSIYFYTERALTCIIAGLA